MNTINTNPGVRPTSTGAVEDPNIAAQVAAKEAAAYQPYVFVDGEPPPMAGVSPAGTHTAGLTAPRQSTVLARQVENLSADLGAMIAMNPTSTTEANTYASLFAMQDVMIRLMLQMRTDSLKSRDSEMVLMREQKTLAIEKGLQAAKWEMIAGITTGAGQVASGIASVKAGRKGEGLKDSGIAVGKYSGFGSILSGSANIVGAGMTYFGSSKTKVEQQEAELAAELANNRMSQANERAATQLEAFRAIAQSQLAILQTNVEAVKRTYA